MALSPEQNAAILAKLQEKVKRPRCALCGSETWSVNDGGIVMLPLQDSFEGRVLRGPASPSVLIVCTNCGNTHLLNVFILGVADALGIKPGGR